MYIETLKEVSALPAPALGLLPAIHDAEVEDTVFNAGQFTYQVVATNSPVSYAATNLPAGLSLNTQTGLITGTPAAEGVFNVPVTATDVSGGTEQFTLNLNVKIGEPVAQLPPAANAKGRVFRNQSAAPLILPATSKWPARDLRPGELYGSDGRLYYRVVNKQGTTSYYPKHFERSVYTFAFSEDSFAKNDIFEFKRFFYFRLIGNNTTAVWSVIFEAGERVDQSAPTVSYEMSATLTSGSREIQVSDPRISSLVEMMQVAGLGTEEDTRIKSVNTQTSKILLTRAATVSGSKTLTFQATAGPNIQEIKWLPPIMDQEILLTDVKSMSELGIWIKNWGDKSVMNPDGTITDAPNRSDAGFEAYRLVYQNRYPVPNECLPSSSNFILRLRIGQFDTENTIADPRGYAGYVIRPTKEDADGLGS